MGDRFDTARIEAFSDGVFAIAITLLVLEISVPEEDFSNLWRGIADQWPSYLGYATSFLTVGGLWIVHHGIFRRTAYADLRLMIANLLLLMAVSFLPFPTKLVAEAIESTSAERPAVLFYGATLFVTSGLVTGMGRYVAGRPELLRGDVREEIHAVTARAAPSLAFYAAVLVLAVVAPQVAAFGFLAVAVVALLRARGEAAAGERPTG